VIQTPNRSADRFPGKWGLAADFGIRKAGGFRRAWVTSLLLVSLGGLGAADVAARQDAAQDRPMAAVNLGSLPPEAARTHRLIQSGGPFPYEKDGTVFGNRERLLPPREQGHYREYTVPTPGARDRGARRIVCGGAVPTQPEACFYTADHYASFARIAP